METMNENTMRRIRLTQNTRSAPPDGFRSLLQSRRDVSLTGPPASAICGAEYWVLGEERGFRLAMPPTPEEPAVAHQMNPRARLSR
jgi:hypothetical protein